MPRRNSILLSQIRLQRRLTLGLTVSEETAVPGVLIILSCEKQVRGHSSPARIYFNLAGTFGR